MESLMGQVKMIRQFRPLDDAPDADAAVIDLPTAKIHQAGTARRIIKDAEHYRLLKQELGESNECG